MFLGQQEISWLGLGCTKVTYLGLSQEFYMIDPRFHYYLLIQIHNRYQIFINEFRLGIIPYIWLTHWSLNKMVNILPTTVPNLFSSMKMIEVQMFSYLVSNRQKACGDPIQYASPGVNDLIIAIFYAFSYKFASVLTWKILLWYHWSHIHWVRNYFISVINLLFHCWAPSHYLNQCNFFLQSDPPEWSFTEILNKVCILCSPRHSHPPTCQMLVIITEGRSSFNEG